MKQNHSRPESVSIQRSPLNRLISSIGTKIILPYLILTLVVAGVGAFIVVRLVAGSLQERFNNQLLDAGRIVSEEMVKQEIERLSVLQTVISTQGVSESLAAKDKDALAGLVPQIIANNNSTDAVELLDLDGQEIMGWQRPPNQSGTVGQLRSGSNYAEIEEVQRVLSGIIDEYGERRTLIGQTPNGLMIFTIGPVYQGETRVGAAMVGTYVSEEVKNLTDVAAAKITFYDTSGAVLETSLAGERQEIDEVVEQAAPTYDQILSLLRESPTRYPVIASTADNEVLLDRVTVLGQEYTLAYGDWRLRNQSIGFFSVALPNNFIVSTAATSRNILSLLFSVATIGVFIIGFIIAQRIIRPLNKLVQTSLAITQGNLSQRTGITRNDEIGSLASSFDVMTDRLERRNRELVEQASKLETILNSTADAIIVLNPQGVIVSTNFAAKRILADSGGDFLVDIMRELPGIASESVADQESHTKALAEAELKKPKRYKVGTQVYSTLVAPMATPEGERLGTVVALRDATREAEAEQLKDSFITGVSHDLRTPLTAIKGFSDLLMLTKDTLNDHQLRAAETINRNVDNLAKHINKIIEISEMQEGTININLQDTCLAPLIKEVAESWRDKLETKGLTLVIELPEGGLCTKADPVRLRWAFDNLLSNACNYTMEGEVKVALFKTDTEARLDVSDTGIGIAVADQPYLFTRFFRASHPNTFEVNGVGLGLFITRSLIELQGGRVWATSKLGSGSTFSIALPLCPTNS